MLGDNWTIQAGQVWVGPFETKYRYLAKGEWKFVLAALYNTHQFAHLEGRIFLGPEL